jgi:hypothetical protein
MTTPERVVAAAREDAQRYFSPTPLSSVEILGEQIAVGGGSANWLVRVESEAHVLVVAVVTGPDGEAVALHHTSMAA